MKKMKKIILFSFFLTGISLAQSFEWCLDSLYSENYVTKCEAIDYVSAFEPEGTTEVLVELIDQQQPYLQIRFLNILYSLDYENVVNEAYALISRADEFAYDPDHPWDPLDAKVDATTILVYKGDFSTIGYVFEKLNKGEITKYERSAFLLLYDIIKNAPFPDYKKEAKIYY